MRAIAARGPGRPPFDDAESSICTAALAVVGEVGYERATMGLIADRASVGRSTVYRRYATKDDLLAAALQSLAVRPSQVTGGDARRRLVDLLFAIAGEGTSTEPRLLAALTIRAAESPALLELLRRHRIDPHREMLMGIVREAIQEGSLPDDIDSGLIIDLALGLITWRSLTQPDTTVDRQIVDRAVRLLWDGAR